MTRKQNVGFFKFFQFVVGKLCREMGGGYESEEEERVRWLFIGISEVGAVEVWSYS